MFAFGRLVRHDLYAPGATLGASSDPILWPLLLGGCGTVVSVVQSGSVGVSTNVARCLHLTANHWLGALLTCIRFAGAPASRYRTCFIRVWHLPYVCPLLAPPARRVGMAKLAALVLGTWVAL